MVAAFALGGPVPATAMRGTTGCCRGALPGSALRVRNRVRCRNDGDVLPVTRVPLA